LDFVACRPVDYALHCGTPGLICYRTAFAPRYTTPPHLPIGTALRHRYRLPTPHRTTPLERDPRWTPPEPEPGDYLTPVDWFPPTRMPSLRIAATVTTPGFTHERVHTTQRCRLHLYLPSRCTDWFASTFGNMVRFGQTFCWRTAPRCRGPRTYPPTVTTPHHLFVPSDRSPALPLRSIRYWTTPLPPFCRCGPLRACATANTPPGRLEHARHLTQVLPH